MKKKLQIAIDGPVASGKSTIVPLIAQKLGLLYVDTGTMYRAVALLGMRKKVNLKDEKRLLKLLRKNKIEFKILKENHGKCEIFLNKENITKKIRIPEISLGASLVATLPKIREFLVRKQKEIARGGSVVMEGRDITTVVLPKADLKIFLTADQKTRVKRRQEQLRSQGVKKSFKEVLAETKKRDYQDTHRKTDPLKIVPGAFVLDTTDLTVEEVVEKILGKVSNLKKFL